MIIRYVKIILIALFFIPFYSGAQEYVLVWQDEFNETSLNTNAWNYDLGNGCPNLCGWGNNELEYYTEENVSFNDGKLVITAKEESISGYNFSSAKIHTRNKQTFTYGKFEARIKLPTGQGIWPAFWLLFNDPTYGGWPTSGEIDIAELVGHEPDVVHGTIHYGGATKGGQFDLPIEDFSDGFHTFSVEWDSTKILWFVDSIQYAGITKYGIDQGFNWPFDHPFYIIFNLAVGGNWPGSPNNTTSFPQTMEIDWVRVYQKVVVNPIEELSIEEIITIAPNPIQNNVLNIKKSSTEKLQYKIINILGEQIKTGEIQDLNSKINLNEVKAGLYYLMTNTEKSEKILSFVVPN
jgi:beta-glucanase (GH16 family)